ncbi:MAG: hypothetical protein QG671_2417 [Actinomycetota bacterium]|nr:hypothetical protein [Actinomycetota bacterium]
MTHLYSQEFYAWAYGDLFTNTTRGVLAEYIVATALGICDTKRVEWNQYDLEIDGAESEGAESDRAETDGAETDGAQAEKKRVGIEVKSAAYVQAWKQDRPSEIVFSIRRAQGWDERTNTTADSATRSAAVYVFCVLEGKVKKSIDPLDVSHWTFYVVPTAVLESEVPTRKTIGLARLKQLAEVPRTYDQLKDAIYEAAAENQRG